MSILERIKAKIRATNETTPQPAPNAKGETVMTVTNEEERRDPTNNYQIPIHEGEFLPWKGHVFKITSVGKMDFVAECVGITNARAKELGLKR